MWTLRTIVVALGRGAGQVLSLSEPCGEGRPQQGLGGKAMAHVSGSHQLGRALKEQPLGETVATVLRDLLLPVLETWSRRRPAQPSGGGTAEWGFG